jgi:hypothetical protein
MYNLSGIQKGIQCGHAAVEYSRHSRDGRPAYADYNEFADQHKTFILLDGGSSGDMKTRVSELRAMGIPYAAFFEPDLNNSLSAIAFILPEEIYGIDLNDPGIEGDDEYERAYNIKSYISKFRLASN